MNNIQYIVKANLHFAQAYGADNYGDQIYNGDEQSQGGGGNPVNPGNNNPGNNTTTETAPNTGILGMPQDAAIASMAGALLLAVAIIGTILVLAARARSRKNQKTDQ